MQTDGRLTKVEGTTHEFNLGLRRKFKTSGAPTKPYLVAFELFLKDAYDIALDDSKIHLVFDTQNVVQAGVVEHFNHSWAGHRYPDGKQFATIAYHNSVDEPALQIADLYAYAWGRALHKSWTDEVRHAMRRLLAPKPRLGIADAEFFQRGWDNLQKDLAPENRIAGVADERLDVHIRPDDQQ